MTNQTTGTIAFPKEATKKTPLPRRVLLNEGFGHDYKEFGETEPPLDAASAIAEAESILGLSKSQPEIIEGQIENSTPDQEISLTGSLQFQKLMETTVPLEVQTVNTSEGVSIFSEGFVSIDNITNAASSTAEFVGKQGAETFSAIAGLKDYLAPVEAKRREDPAEAKRKADEKKKIQELRAELAHQNEIVQQVRVVEQQKAAKEDERLEVAGMTADQKNDLLGIQRGVRIVIGIFHRVAMALKVSAQKKAAAKPKEESNFEVVCKKSSKQAAAGMFNKNKQDGNSFANAIAGAG